jgi:hypothetical protein
MMVDLKALMSRVSLAWCEGNFILSPYLVSCWFSWLTNFFNTFEVGSLFFYGLHKLLYYTCTPVLH